MDFVEVLNNIGFDWRMALANLVNFLIILLILKKFALNPIRKKLEERESTIEKGIEDARKAATELQTAEQTRDKTLMNARVESSGIISQATETSNKIIADAKKLADEKHKEAVKKIKEVIEDEKQKMIQEAKEEIINIVLVATEKLLTEKIDPKTDKKIIEDSLK